MWKVVLSVESHRRLSVVPGVRRLSPVGAAAPARNDRPVRKPRTKPRSEEQATAPLPSKRVRASSEGAMRSSMLDSPPTYWTESTVYTHLCDDARVQPTLKDVREFTVRRHGADKLLCTFVNNHNEECIVWVSGVLVSNRYPRVYDRAHAEFLHKLSRR